MALYQKDHLQLLGYGIYIQMLMIIWLRHPLGMPRDGPSAHKRQQRLRSCVQEKYFHQI
jgi:hypothetical protein